MPKDSLPLLPTCPLSGYTERTFLDKLFFLNVTQSMDYTKIFQVPFSDPKGEADTIIHSKKSLFHLST